MPKRPSWAVQQGGVVGEHGLMEVVQFASGLDPQLLDQHLAGVAVGLQRVGLAAAAIQGEHQLGVKALPPGMPTREVLELGNQLGVPPGGEVGLDAHLQGGHMLLLQTRDLGRRERQRSKLRERRATPQVQRLTQHGGGPFDASSRERLAACRDQALEALGVKLAGTHPQPIARRRRHKHVGVTERLAQPRHMDLNRLYRALRRVLTPHRERQALSTHRLIGMQHKHGQQGARLGTRNRHRTTVGAHLKRTEDPKLHHLPPRTVLRPHRSPAPC
jgi:hypothetical protein